MYTIKQAAARSGVPIQLLRAWERRYGVVEPQRTGSGYRLYDEEAIQRLRAMRMLIGEGWTASNAAARVAQLDDAAVADLLRGAARSPAPSAAMSEPDGGAAQALRAALVEAASRLDEPEFEQVLDDMFARGSFEQVASELIMPALVDLGQAWADGRIDVAGEHAASSAVERRLGQAFMAAGAPRDGTQVVLVGMPPGGRHELGALAFATGARRAGLEVRYLGADLPVQDWVNAAHRTSAAAVVIGVVVRNDVKAALEVGRAVREANAGTVVAFGGTRASAVPLDGLDGAMILPDDLSLAVGALREGLSGG